MKLSKIVKDMNEVILTSIMGHNYTVIKYTLRLLIAIMKYDPSSARDVWTTFNFDSPVCSFFFF